MTLVTDVTLSFIACKVTVTSVTSVTHDEKIVKGR